MGPGARGARAALLVGALQVLALLGAADPNETAHNGSIANNSSTAKPTPSVSLPGSNITTVLTKSTVTSKTAAPEIATNTTSTTSKSTSKVTSVSPNVTQTSTSVVTTTHNSLLTSLTITATIHSNESKGSKFDTGSFVGGIALTLGVLSLLYVGCKMYYSRRGIRYRTIDEHDAII